MSQRDAEKVEMMKDIPRKEEFQKYLEKAGVIDQLTKLLVSLYENPDRPENALDYIKQFLGANHGQNANEEKLQQRIAELESEMKQKDEEIATLKQQLNSGKADEEKPKEENDGNDNQEWAGASIDGVDEWLIVNHYWAQIESTNIWYDHVIRWYLSPVIPHPHCPQSTIPSFLSPFF